ncbi:exported protein of unknown function [Beijerinckiaceae bacterium RH AL1]|nr:hypothetical protein [Beijerinckiaceae bacterium]VVB47088.1 exported protein of unknown function [Beijerinckiaceae bacterium RH CH11]VVB47171.1 exported protein of unknown function [Beijerinckiaceae bacterium RH AL8]VVC55709.1 exported protein of unknown function [Beijerinckiaceae bacterium RH AL1]
MAIARPILVSTAMVCMAFAALAQTPPSDTAPGHADPYAHDKYITGTGATVPNPGRSQSGGTTPLDRGIQNQDNAIDKSICKGC